MAVSYVQPLFIQRTSDAGYHEEFDPVNNGMNLGGLIMDSAGDGIDMNTTKVFALGAGDTAGDALGWGQAGVQLGDTIFTDDVDLGHNIITNLNGPPVNPEDAANKAYVDAIAQGLDVHTGVWAKLDSLASWTSTGTGPTHVLTAPSNNVSWNTVDGHLFAATGAGQRVLVDDGTANPDNGVYYVSQLGNGTLFFKLTRAADADQAIALELARGLYVFVNDGTVYENTGWFEQLEVAIIETDDVQFAQFSGAPGLTFDQGLIRSLASVKVDLHTAADAAGAGAAGGSSGLEFNVNTATGMLRAAVQTKGAIERGQGVAAAGSLTALAKAALADNDIFTLNDGVNTPTVFEFDKSGSYTPTPGYIPIHISTDTTAAQVADRMRTAINGVTTTLAITADATGLAKIVLTNDAVGTAGNQTITETLSSGTLTPENMAGGQNAGLKARVDGTTIVINASNQLEAAGATSAEEAKKIENTFATSVVNLTPGKPVYVSAADTVDMADTDTDVHSRVIGVSRLAVTAPASVEVVTVGLVPSVWAGSGVSGSPYYLANGGGLSVSLPAGAKRVIQIGVAKNTNDLIVRLYDFGKKAA